MANPIILHTSATLAIGTITTLGGIGVLRGQFENQAETAYEDRYGGSNIEFDAFKHQYVTARYVQTFKSAGLSSSQAKAVALGLGFGNDIPDLVRGYWNEEARLNRLKDLWNNEGGADEGDSASLSNILEIDENLADAIKANIDGGEAVTNHLDQRLSTFDPTISGFENTAALDEFAGLSSPIDSGGATPPIPPRKPEPPLMPPPAPEGGGSVWEWIQRLFSPLVLDLDGDGIELVSLANATHYFDLTGDGFGEASGWVSGDDGLLTIDLNEDGIVNDITELFGSATIDGFTILTPYDTNHDDVIDENDAQWADLRVWTDENGNGHSEATELHSLDELGILSISLSAVTAVDYDLEGNHISHESTFTIDSGGGAVTRDIVDAWFATDTMNTAYLGDYTFDFRAIFLPTLRGTGQLADLHAAMSVDNEGAGNLLDLVKDLAFTDFADLFTDAADDLIHDILYRWAGVDAVDPESRGQYLDARSLGFMEKLFGSPYIQNGYSSNPLGARAGNALSDLWDQTYGYLKAHLLFQAGAKGLFSQDAYYDFVEGTLAGDLTLDETAITTTLSDAADNAADGEAFWIAVAQFLQFVKDPTATERDWLDQAVYDSGVSGLSDWGDVEALFDPVIGETWTGSGTHSGTALTDILTGGTGSDTINGLGGDDTILGGGGADTLDGGDGDDTITGGTGTDMIYGGAGNDFIRVSASPDNSSTDTVYDGDGSDYIVGNQGNQTYNYTSGDDGIEDTGGTDKIVILDNTLGIADLSFLRGADGTLEITVGSLGHIFIANQWYSAANSIETIEFTKAGESAFNLAALAEITTKGSDRHDYITGVSLTTARKDTIYGYGGNDHITGGGNDDTLYGGADQDFLEGNDGNDKLYGEDGNDTLSGLNGNDEIYGGAGNDSLDGGTGNDILDGGDGDDYMDGKNDADTYYGGAGNDTIHDTSDGNSTVHGGDGNDIITAGGTIYGDDGDDSIVGTATNTIYGGAGNDTITTTSNVDTIDGGSGDDTITTGNGADIIDGGDGNDTINGEAQNDTIEGGAGNDILLGGTQDDTIYGEDGDDVIDGGDDYDTLFGGAGNDTYVISGPAHNNDTVTDASGTRDYLDFTNGVRPENLTITVQDTDDLKVRYNTSFDHVLIVDQLNTGDTKQVERVRFDDQSELDLLRYSSWVFGTASGETMNGANNVADILIGLAGNDTLKGFSGNDILLGGDGNDTLEGGVGNDEIYGGAGNDTITGGSNDDVMMGGAGNDSLSDSGGNNIFVGGDGDDSLSANNGNDVFYDVIYRDQALSDPLAMDDDGDNFNGGGGNDTFIIQAMDNQMNGVDGDDTYKIYFHPSGVAGSTNDVWDSSGDDTLILANLDYAGTDWYLKFVGNNLYLVYTGTSSDSEIRIMSQFGGYDGNNVPLFAIDEFVFADSVSFSFRDFVVTEGTTGADNITGGSENDYIVTNHGGDTVHSGGGIDFVTGGNGADVFYGEDGDDFLFGFAGNDTLNGDGGKDGLSGGDGNDLLYGGAGDDNLQGDAGADELHGGDGDDVLNGGNTAESDTLYGDAGNDTLSGGSGNDTIYGGEGSDSVHAGFDNDIVYGDAGNDVLAGERGNDTIYGGDGNDSLYGEDLNSTLTDGDDTLYGGNGADVLQGNNGNDILHGEDGLDQLYGNAGADTFVFESASAFNNVDQIHDFNTGESDAIDISDILSGYYAQGVDDITDFVRITDNGTNSTLAIDQDGGADNFVSVATILGVTGLTDEAALESAGRLVTV
jgi:Ca2+-binding RTX toxin-like protein